MRVARFYRGFLQGVRGKFRLDIAGVAVGEDVEAGGLWKGERDAGVGIRDFDVGFRRGREAECDVAVAVVDFYLAGGIFYGHRIAIGAESDVSRRIHDFEIAGAGFHVAGEGSKSEIGALGNEAEAFGNFVGADGAVKFAVECETAGGRGNVDLPALSRNFYVAFSVCDFHVAFVHFDGDIAGGVANFDVATGAGDGNRGRHIGDGDLTFFVSNSDSGFPRDLDIHVYGDAAVAGAHAGGMDFVAVAILNDFNGNGAGAA